MSELKSHVNGLFAKYKSCQKTDELKAEILSNLWFSRPIKIDGPYNFALMLARYFTPLVTIVLPLSINSLPKYIIKNEVKSDAKQEK